MKNLITIVLLTAAAGCENAANLKGQVEVSPAIQSLFSNQDRGLVMVSADIPKSSFPFYAVGVLCDPQTATVTLPFDFGDKLGCANEGKREGLLPWPEPPRTQRDRR